MGCRCLQLPVPAANQIPSKWWSQNCEVIGSIWWKLEIHHNTFYINYSNYPQFTDHYLGNTVPIIFYVVGSIWNWSGNTPAQPVVSMQLHLSQVFRSQRYIHGKPCKTLRQTTVHSWWVLPTMYQAWWPMFLWRLFWVRLTLLLVLLWGYHQIYTRKIPAQATGFYAQIMFPTFIIMIKVGNIITKLMCLCFKK